MQISLEVLAIEVLTYYLGIKQLNLYLIVLVTVIKNESTRLNMATPQNPEPEIDNVNPDKKVNPNQQESKTVYQIKKKRERGERENSRSRVSWRKFLYSAA